MGRGLFPTHTVSKSMLVCWGRKSSHADMNSSVPLTLMAKEQALAQDLYFIQNLICPLSSVINFASKKGPLKDSGIGFASLLWLVTQALGDFLSRLGLIR